MLGRSLGFKRLRCSPDGFPQGPPGEVDEEEFLTVLGMIEPERLRF